MDSDPQKSEPTVGVSRQFAEVGKMTAGVGPLKIICKDEFRGQAQYERHVPQTVGVLISREALQFAASDLQLCRDR